MMPQLETKFLPLTIEASTEQDAPKGTITGYGSVFGVRDNGGDIVMPGAFSKSIASGRKVLMLWQHNPDRPIGVWTEIDQDAHGLRVKGQISLNTQLGREAYALLEMGALDGLSMGYRATVAEKTADARLIQEVELWEVSIVSFPMNRAATIAEVKAAPADDTRNAEEGDTSPEEIPAIAATEPVIEEDTHEMTPEEMKAAIDAAVNPLTARITEVETKAARGDLKVAAPAVEVKESAEELELKAMRDTIRAPEQKAFQVTGDSGGRFAIPHTLAAAVQAVARLTSPVAAMVKNVSVSQASYSELLDGDEAGFEWVGEEGTRNTTANPTVKEVRPVFGEVSAIAEASRQVLNDAAFDVDGWLKGALASGFAKAIAAAIYTGNGTNKPKGLFASGSGIDSDQVTAFDYATLIALHKSVLKEYRKAYVMSSETEATLMGLVDSNGRPVFVQSLATDAPSTLFGVPIVIDETADGIALGDLARAYVLATVEGMSFLVDPYTRPGYIRVRAYKRVGGIVRDAAALKRITLV